MIDISHEDWWSYYNNIFSARASDTVAVVEKDEVIITSVLGPDGTPYALRRPKIKVGFDLSPK